MRARKITEKLQTRQALDFETLPEMPPFAVPGMDTSLPGPEVKEPQLYQALRSSHPSCARSWRILAGLPRP